MYVWVVSNDLKKDTNGYKKIGTDCSVPIQSWVLTITRNNYCQ